MPGRLADNPRIEPAGRRPTWAEIDLDALAENYRIIRKRVTSEVQVMAVVKANAYGHGAAQCARRLAAEGADWFGVGLPEEGIELRDVGIRQPILCLGGFWEGQAAAVIQNNLVPVVYRLDMIEALDLTARDAGVVADVHVKVDTGMGRLGVPFDQVGEFVNTLPHFKNIRLDGLMTHFAAADEPSRDSVSSDQLKRFETAVDSFRDRGFTFRYQHAANSAAIFGNPLAWGNMIRPGGALYGLWRDILPPLNEETGLRPVMSLRSRITLLKWVGQGETVGYGCTFQASRMTHVATLPIGYDDGYMRRLSNQGKVIIRGAYASVIGRISMDLTLVDVTDVPRAVLGDQVTLIGTDGNPTVTAEDLAETAGTLSYEVTCGISERVPRIYL